MTPEDQARWRISFQGWCDGCGDARPALMLPSSAGINPECEAYLCLVCVEEMTRRFAEHLGEYAKYTVA